MTPFLELKNVSKSYGGHTVLKQVNLSVDEGEFLAIVGYSGSGKTTLINLIAGLHRADEGTVLLHEKAITAPGPDRGIVFQNYSLLPWLTVYDNVHLAVAQIFPQWSADQQKAQVEKYLGMVNLTPALQKFPHELSGGMRQRVSVARALAGEPEVLLLDEPLSALDALTRSTLQDEILKIWTDQHRTVVLITNDVDEALLLADRVIPLTVGPGATLGPEFSVQLPRPRNRETIGHEPLFKKLKSEIVDFLLDQNSKQKTKVNLRLRLPDLLPEDLDAPRAPFGAKRQPRRRSELKTESVEIPT